MKSRWKIIVAAVLAVAVVFAGGFFSSRLVPTAPELLMVVTADGLTASDAPGNTQKISVTGVEKTATWFTDRPEHAAGQDTTDNLLTDFFTDYPDNPPNVTIAMMVDGVPATRVVTLSNPQWDGDVLTFDSEPLTHDPLGVLPAAATDISITIDDAYCMAFAVEQVFDANGQLVDMDYVCALYSNQVYPWPF